jgi:hypothetical protein
MAKKVFNLSIKDLKEILGVVKKKRKTKKNKKLINYIGIRPKTRRASSRRASSQHMIPSNVSTLQSENLHLINKQLENKIVDKENKVDDQLVVKDDSITKLQDDINYVKNIGMGLYNDFYSKQNKKSFNLSSNKSKNMDSSNVIRPDTFDDNIDVGTTQGSDTFQDFYDEKPSIQELPPVTPIKEENVDVQTPEVSHSKVYIKPDYIPEEANPLKQSARIKENNEAKEKQEKKEEKKERQILKTSDNFQKKKDMYLTLAKENNIEPNKTIFLTNSLSTINNNLIKINEQIRLKNIANDTPKKTPKKKSEKK